MSFDVPWDVDKYRDGHESEEHWLLRKTFMERWKQNYPEDRLGHGFRIKVAEEYRKIKKTKLQRTFVSASDAAGDRARGIKREGGVIIESTPSKSAKINFVPQGHADTKSDSENETDNVNNKTTKADHSHKKSIPIKQETEPNDYLTDLLKIKCIDIRNFNDRMFQTQFGRFVLIIRAWTSKLGNIQSSCQACKLKLTSAFEDNVFTVNINDHLVATAHGTTKAAAKQTAEDAAWDMLQKASVSVLVKEQWISEGDRISVGDVSGKNETFGTRVENSVATKMMKLMGWKGGGLGAGSQGISEPIQPQLQMVNRSGLGCSPDIRHMRVAGYNLMRRYIESDSFDVDLVFSSEFSKEERAVLHKCAQSVGLASKSYSSDEERFLVVKKKLNPFSLVKAVVDKGGDTPKYRVFVPAAIGRR